MLWETRVATWRNSSMNTVCLENERESCRHEIFEPTHPPSIFSKKEIPETKKSVLHVNEIGGQFNRHYHVADNKLCSLIFKVLHKFFR